MISMSPRRPKKAEMRANEDNIVQLHLRTGASLRRLNWPNISIALFFFLSQNVTHCTSAQNLYKIKKI
jgi:hypothetical protein